MFAATLSNLPFNPLHLAATATTCVFTILYCLTSMYVAFSLLLYSGCPYWANQINELRILEVRDFPRDITAFTFRIYFLCSRQKGAFGT